MATWKVQITGKRRPAIDPDQLLGAVLALGRQFAEENRQQHLREAAKAQSERSPEEQPADSETSAAATTPQSEVR